MSELDTMWDFDDPAGSEARFRAAAETAADDRRRVLLTQVARALGLQARFEEAHAVLDDPDLEAGGIEVGVRRSLERGRLHRSAGDPRAARPWFVQAALAAGAGRLEALQVDALHMVALVGAPAEQVGLTEEALAIARTASDPVARAWEASLLNNLGMVHADADRWESALVAFEEALAARTARGDDDGATRVARWMVAWTLRHLGRTDEALEMQRALRAELDAAGGEDPYVDEEIALLDG